MKRVNCYAIENSNMNTSLQLPVTTNLKLTFADASVIIIVLKSAGRAGLHRRNNRGGTRFKPLYNFKAVD